MRKIFLILIILIFAASISADTKTCSAGGRIDDDNGNPVSEAFIYTDGIIGDIDIIIVAHSRKKTGLSASKSTARAARLIYGLSLNLMPGKFSFR